MDQTAPDLDKITRQLEKAEQILQENLQSKEEEYKRQMEQLETHLSKTSVSIKNKYTASIKTTVIEGVIWSEILGPPRAKNPFQFQLSKIK